MWARNHQTWSFLPYVGRLVAVNCNEFVNDLVQENRFGNIIILNEKVEAQIPMMTDVDWRVRARHPYFNQMVFESNIQSEIANILSIAEQ